MSKLPMIKRQCESSQERSIFNKSMRIPKWVTCKETIALSARVVLILAQMCGSAKGYLIAGCAV